MKYSWTSFSTDSKTTGNGEYTLQTSKDSTNTVGVDYKLSWDGADGEADVRVTVDSDDGDVDYTMYWRDLYGTTSYTKTKDMTGSHNLTVESDNPKNNNQDYESTDLYVNGTKLLDTTGDSGSIYIPVHYASGSIVGGVKSYGGTYVYDQVFVDADTPGNSSIEVELGNGKGDTQRNSSTGTYNCTLNPSTEIYANVQLFSEGYDTPTVRSVEVTAIPAMYIYEGGSWVAKPVKYVNSNSTARKANDITTY